MAKNSAPTPAPAKPLVQLENCRVVSDPAVRLSCYDAAVEALTAATAKGDTVVIDRAQVHEARRGLFGFSLPQLGFLSSRSNNPDDNKDDRSLETKIVSARPFGYGLWRIQIEGGAMWETTAVDPGFTDPTPGSDALIERGAFGSYFLKVGRGQRVKAKRVQ
ncbi:MAG: hypothetical protein JSR96_04175 [Proteobacteria bacterium]|nr:hypothetical protein [Pseudomonadota bacterium]